MPDRGDKHGVLILYAIGGLTLLFTYYLLVINFQERENNQMEKNVRNTKIIILVVVGVMLLVILGVVKIMTKSSENSLVGTWRCTTDEEWTLTFSEDGTFYDSDSYFLYYTSVGNWKIPSDGVLYLECVGDSGTVEYELNGNILTIYVTGSVNPSYSFQKSK